MKRISRVLLNMAVIGLVPGVAGAVGTYYDGNLYQNPQSRYGSGNGGYYNTYGNGRYSSMGTMKKTTVTKTTKKKTSNKVVKQGFNLDAGFSHEFASWGFEMDKAGSKLHYDNINWNVLSANGTYYFGDSTPMQIKFGARYGMQFGESPMVDDDISNGGYIVQEWTGANGATAGYQTGHALSVGTSKGGKQMGFNMSIGLTDFFKMGAVKITPSVGYRFLEYELKTENNYGATIEIFDSNDNHPYATCVLGYAGELQCDPILLFYSGNVGPEITGRTEDSDGNLTDIVIPSGATSVDPSGTYYYEQSGTSHKYKTSWNGPYVALDMEYNVDSKNVIYGGIELGLPIYNSKGDQPYRYDWQHPTSVEDKGSLGDAMHLGLNANWSTNITDATSFNLGFTYDYYSVSKATANTYLNPTHYTELYNTYKTIYENGIAAGSLSPEQQAALLSEMETIENYEKNGWTLKDENEIKSIYKSMGIRAGINVKF